MFSFQLLTVLQTNIPISKSFSLPIWQVVCIAGVTICTGLVLKDSVFSLLNEKDEKDRVSPNCKQVLCTFTIFSSRLSHSDSNLTHLQLEEEVWQPCWGNRGTRRPNQPCWLPHKQGCSDNQTSLKLCKSRHLRKSASDHPNSIPKTFWV